MNTKAIRAFTEGAMVAAIYVVLTLISSAMGLSSGVIQLRFSEALTILPLFCPSSVWGLAVGCALANLLSGAALWDVVIGSLATLLGAVGTYFFRKQPALAYLPPVLMNTALIPLLLYFVYGFRDGGLPFLFFTVFLGEAISVWIFGALIHKPLARFFKNHTR